METITGQRLELVKLRIARYFYELRIIGEMPPLGQALKEINNRFVLVEQVHLNALENDIKNLFHYYSNKQLHYIYRKGYLSLRENKDFINRAVMKALLNNVRDVPIDLIATSRREANIKSREIKQKFFKELDELLAS